MKKTININRSTVVSPAEARAAALRAISTDNGVFTYQNHCADQNLYELLVNVCLMNYSCYVDSRTGEVLGLSAEPCAA